MAADNTPDRLPEWFHIRLNTNERFTQVKRAIDSNGLNTVCREARCPNLHECWGEHKTATFMILGDTCTRRCRFCSVKTGRPDAPDPHEPMRVASSIREMGVLHAVITMVDRDDLPDGGAQLLAETVNAIHEITEKTTVEVLSSDLLGEKESIEILVASHPEVTSHNLETVRRLTPLIRSRSDYDRSLAFLKTAKELDPATLIKSSLMLGLGETVEELEETMDDLLNANVAILNLGQYLQPTSRQIPVQRYWHPDEFAALKETALHKGFVHCDSGPMVRSSYHAGDQIISVRKRTHPLTQSN